MSIRIRSSRSDSPSSPVSEAECPRHTALKSFACGVAALAVTAVFGWSFVHTTSIERAAGGTVAALNAAADFGLSGR